MGFLFGMLGHMWSINIGYYTPCFEMHVNTKVVHCLLDWDVRNGPCSLEDTSSKILELLQSKSEGTCLTNAKDSTFVQKKTR